MLSSIWSRVAHVLPVQPTLVRGPALHPCRVPNSTALVRAYARRVALLQLQACHHARMYARACARMYACVCACARVRTQR